MVHELLSYGKDTARTGKELARALNCDIRQLTAYIEKERREGKPICASQDNNAGYYLASNSKELSMYCAQLSHRATELRRTSIALSKTIRTMRKAERESGNTRA